MQQWRWVVIGVVATVVASIVGVAVLLVAGRTGPSDVGSRGLRRLGETGISVAVPDGWVDHRHAKPGALLLETELRPVAGLPVATRGMWVGRWQTADPATELARLKALPGGVWTDGPLVAGVPSVVHEDVIGPPLVQRLPAAVTMHRRELRLVAHGSVDQIGFWGPRSTLGDAVERAVLSHVRIEEPPPIRLVQGSVSMTAPASWSRGHCKGAVCAFSPFVDGRPSDSWVYLFPWKASSLDDGVQQLSDSLAKQPTIADLVREPTEIGGRPAIRVRFGMAPKDTGPAQVEELLVPADRGRFVLVAMGWRTPEGRAQLDSVLQTLRL